MQAQKKGFSMITRGLMIPFQLEIKFNSLEPTEGPRLTRILRLEKKKRVTQN